MARFILPESIPWWCLADASDTPVPRSQRTTTWQPTKGKQRSVVSTPAVADRPWSRGIVPRGASSSASAWSDLPDSLLESIFHQLLVQTDEAGILATATCAGRADLTLANTAVSDDEDDCPAEVDVMPAAAGFRLACQSWAGAGAAAVESVAAQRWCNPPERWEETFSNIRELQLEASHSSNPGSSYVCRVSDKAVRHLGKLQSLKLVWPNDEELESISQLTSLVSLHWSCSNFDDEYRKLSTKLTLRPSSTDSFHSQQAEALRDVMPALLRMRFMSDRIDCHYWSNPGNCAPQRLNQLRFLGNLTSLSISHNMAVDAEGLSCLRHLTKLENLSLEGCTNVGDEELEMLHCCSSLTSLSLSGCCGITDDGVASLLPHLPSLQHLYLPSMCDHHHHPYKGADELGLEAIKQLSALETLHFAASRTCDEISLVGCLQSLPSLTTLELSSAKQLSPLGLSACLQGKTALTSLRLPISSSATRFTDLFQVLSRHLPALTDLNILDCRLCPTSLADLKCLKTLCRLSVATRWIRDKDSLRSLLPDSVEEVAFLNI